MRRSRMPSSANIRRRFPDAIFYGITLNPRIRSSDMESLLFHRRGPAPFYCGHSNQRRVEPRDEGRAAEAEPETEQHRQIIDINS